VAAAAPAAVPASTKKKVDAAVRAVEAALGAHSATNFYKGLAGGDIVASGGLFVATYQVPEVGQELLLKVTMPGGYAFEAKGVVAWRRDVDTGTTASSPPGFGAQFSEISDEGRGLIQRYVRNREPLFHDDN
jgi:Tfp pilus assembly protein PilZ